MNMKKILLTMAVLAMVGSVAMAGPSLGYWNNGDAGSTHQVWSFDTGSGIENNDGSFTAKADVDGNPYGDPTATITAEASGSVEKPGWKELYNGKSGVWAGDPISFELNIPNTPSTGGKKYVFVEVTAQFSNYAGSGYGIPELLPAPVLNADGDVNSYAVEYKGVSVTPDGGQWYKVHYEWEITPNPQIETITGISFTGTGGFVDKIVVDTMCTVPAPGALLLGGFGTALVSFLRRKRSV